MTDLALYSLVGVVFFMIGIYFWDRSTNTKSRNSLIHASVGEVYNFDYKQPHHGESRRIMARVVEPVYTLSDSMIRKLNRNSYYRRNDPNFERTKHLVTCEMPNGDVRQFYAERASNVKRSAFGGRLFKVASLFM